jgi:hypothetical protein
VSAEADLLRLVQRADWTRLSLAAETNDGSKVLLAPGRRYRLQTPARGGSRPSQQSLRGCDGERPWRQPKPGEKAGTQWIGGPEAPLPMLFCPAWLLRDSRLEVRGHVTACGRDAIDVVATERSSLMDPLRRYQVQPGRTEALVDAELGILLRVAYLPGEGSLPEDEEPPDVTELVSLEVDPAVDPAQFTAPPGSAIGQSWGEAFDSDGPVAAAVQNAAGLAAGGIGALINYWKSGRAETASGDTEAGLPQDDPAPEISPDGRPVGPDVSDEVLQLLHNSGAGTFDATAHEWFDASAMFSQIQESVRRPGFGGFGVLFSALADHGPGADYTVFAVRIGGPGQYQVDRQYEAKHDSRPMTVASDGQRRWVVHDDKVTVGPATIPPPDIGSLVDASWLLECWLSGGALIMAGDRPAYRLHAARRDTSPFIAMFPGTAAVAVVDAELGIVLSLTSFLGGKPVRRNELRDVTPTQPGDFRVNIPPDLPVEPAAPQGTNREHPPDTPLKLAGAVAQEVGKEAVKAARNFLRRLNP